MTFKVYDPDTWQTQKDLQIYDGTQWKSAVRGWIHDGTIWKIAYPEYPVKTGTNPVISGTAQYGSTLSVNTSTWSTVPAYAPTSYSYQWNRNGVAITGATNSTYVLVGADVGQLITCTVSGVNGRGPTPYTTASVTPKPVASGLTLLDTTLTPTDPAFSTLTANANGTFSASWTTSTNATDYTVSSSSGTVSYTSGTTSATGSGASGSFTVYVSAVNTSKKVLISWTASPGATDYDLSWTGAATGSINTTSTSYTLTIGSVGGQLNVVLTPKYNTLVGVTQSGNITAANKYSNTISQSTTVPIVPTITLGAATSDSTSVTLNWTSTNQSSYTISGDITGSGTTATTATITGLVADTTYNYTVTITSSTGNTASQTSSIRTTGSAPSSVAASYTGTVLTDGNLIVPGQQKSIATGTAFTVGTPTANALNCTFTYQWYTSTDGITYTAISGATTNTYTIPSTGGGKAYYCRVTATNTFGSAYRDMEIISNIWNNSTRAKLVSNGTAVDTAGVLGGAFSWTNPSNTQGIGSTYDNYSYGPWWGVDYTIYQGTSVSSTTGSTYTQATSGTATNVSVPIAGFFFIRIYSYNGNFVNTSSSLRVPATGCVEFT